MQYTRSAPERVIEAGRVISSYKETNTFFSKTLQRSPFNRFLDLVEIVVNDRDGTALAENIANLFEEHAAAYRLDRSRRPYQLVPRSSMEQGETTSLAVETLHEAGMDGASSHLAEAASHINAQQYADAIADSIHAVESVARIIDPRAKTTLGPALTSLQEAAILKHPALTNAFKQLYGYTSDERGIRHSLLDKDAPDVDLDLAVFMYGACASFAAYLVNKNRQVQEQKGNGQ